MSLKQFFLLSSFLIGVNFLLVGCIPSELVNKQKKVIVSPTTAVTATTVQAIPETIISQSSTADDNNHLPIVTISDFAQGPLTVSSVNSRYFTDGSGKVVYLTGSHTWSNLQDIGQANPPPEFNYLAYLDFLKENNHNFFRLWSWEQTRWTLQLTENNYWFGSLPYMRAGPGDSLDGQPKFDLTKFDQAYFDNMRSRVIAAGEQGIYVSIMLFDGWSVASSKGGFSNRNPWQGHPFNQSNNINGINGDTNGDNSGIETHELGNPAVTALQEVYVRKVIDTVNDLDNVLFEISNESHENSQDWQYYIINFIKSYEATLPKQHPVGMTIEWPNGSVADLLASPADWISPNGDISNPAIADGKKVIIYDTDHICGICGDWQWVWKSFLRGNNPIFMDPYDHPDFGTGYIDPNSEEIKLLRRNLGYSLNYAYRVDLSNMTPRTDMCSTEYCLVKNTQQDAEYLVYLPNGKSAVVDMSQAVGEYQIEWFNPRTGATVNGASIAGGGFPNLQVPFSGDAVLYIYQMN